MVAKVIAGRTAAAKPAKKAATKATKRKTQTEPPAHYAVYSETDEHEQVWHYPVRVVGGSIGGHAVAGEQCPVPYFMSPELRTATGRLKRAAAAVRFKSRARAVRFACEAAALERDLLRELSQGMGQALA